jgi:transposase-like protein
MMEVGIMPRRQISPEEIIHILREEEVLICQGRMVKDVAKQLGVTEQTYYRWRNAHGGMAPIPPASGLAPAAVL